MIQSAISAETVPRGSPQRAALARRKLAEEEAEPTEIEL